MNLGALWILWVVVGRRKTERVTTGRHISRLKKSESDLGVGLDVLPERHQFRKVHVDL